jgi:DNA-binding transcriptional ArsR family regulator
MILMSTTPGDADDIRLLRVLGNKYNAEIISATHEQRSAQQLSEELDIPIATSYRRIDELTDVGLLELEDSILTDERKRTDVYRRDVDEITIEFGEDDIAVTVERRPEIKNKLDNAWRTLSESGD